MLLRFRNASVGTATPDAGVISPTSIDSSLETLARGRFSPSPDRDPQNDSQNTALGGSIDLPPLPVVRLRGVELHAITQRQCIEHILTAMDEGRGGSVVTPNLDILRRCSKDLNFAALVSESDLVVPDGMPLILASRIQGTPLPERVAGSDLIGSLCAAAADAGRSVFLLGGLPGSAEGAAKVLQTRSPALKVTGTYCPPMGFEDSPTEMAAMIEALTIAKPDIVWVALGSPKQELLINRIRDVLPASWWLGVGISFSFLCGDVQRAPRWAQVLCLEWLHRVIQEPKKLLKRYFVHGIPFAMGLMASAFYQRMFVTDEESIVGHRYRGRRATKKNEIALTTISSASDPAGSPLAQSSIASLMKPQVSQTLLTPAENASEDASYSGPDVIVHPRNDAPSSRGLKRLKAIILLGGKVRQSSFGSAIGRSVLDLPLDENGTIFNHWVTQSNELARRVGLDGLLVRVMVDQKGHEPKSIDPQHLHMVRVERDRSSFRGTGGLIADIAADYADDDLILVANAAQILLDPLAAIAQALDHKTGDFTLISHRDGTASGIMLLACKTVRGISNEGYIDLKEQALPRISATHDVRVVHCRQPTGLPLFEVRDYISALQQHHRRRSSRRARVNPLGEEFGRHFSIVEPGANVAADAYIHDAVILSGATVESGAATIRSLVLPGATVRRGSQVSDTLVRSIR